MDSFKRGDIFAMLVFGGVRKAEASKPMNLPLQVPHGSGSLPSSRVQRKSETSLEQECLEQEQSLR